MALALHIAVLIGVPVAPLPNQLSANASVEAVEVGQVFVHTPPHWRLEWSSWFLASFWPRLTVVAMRSKSTDEIFFLSLSLFLSLPLSPFFLLPSVFQIDKQIAKSLENVFAFVFATMLEKLLDLTLNMLFKLYMHHHF